MDVHVPKVEIKTRSIAGRADYAHTHVFVDGQEWPVTAFEVGQEVGTYQTLTLKVRCAVTIADDPFDGGLEPPRVLEEA